MVREGSIGRILGASAASDVYNASFQLPDFLNYLLAAGALSVVFIPIFGGYLARGEEERGWRAFSAIASFLAVLLVALTAVLFALAPALARWIAPGFSDAQIGDLVRLTRIVLPAQIFHVLGGLLSAALQARDRHALPALAPIVYTGGIVAGGLLGGSSFGPYGFAWGALAGSLAGPFLLPLIGCLRSGLRWRFTWSPRDPDLRAYLARSLPIMLGFSIVVSLMGMVNTMVLSVFERTREIGMLRTIGMTRRQARRMIRHESVITALIGAALGLGLGVFLSALVTKALQDSDLAFSLPVPTLVVFTLVAVVAGIGAAVMPARRASRLNVLDALHYE